MELQLSQLHLEKAAHSGLQLPLRATTPQIFMKTLPCTLSLLPRGAEIFLLADCAVVWDRPLGSAEDSQFGAGPTQHEERYPSAELSQWPATERKP